MKIRSFTEDDDDDDDDIDDDDDDDDDVDGDGDFAAFKIATRTGSWKHTFDTSITTFYHKTRRELERML